MNIQDLIQSRYSVRDFRSDPIPQDVLQDILEAGRLAPSAQNRQPWRYIVFDDPEDIRILTKKTGLIGLSNFFIKDAPVVIVACADLKKNTCINGKDYYLVDTAISFQQMILTAWHHGIGSCWMAAFSEKLLAKHLGLPKSWKIVAISPFGYPKDKKTMYSKFLSTVSQSKDRQPLPQIVQYWKSM